MLSATERRLAGWTVMGSTLAYEYPLDKCPALRAGLPGALVNTEIVLKIAAAVDPIDAGPIAADAFIQGFADPLP